MDCVLNAANRLIEKAFTVKNVERSKRLTVEKLENFAGSLKFARNVAKINLRVMKRYARNVWLTKLNIELITH